MPKYIATVRQEILVKVSVHAANEKFAAAAAEQVVLGWGRTDKATTLVVEELGRQSP